MGTHGYPWVPKRQPNDATPIWSRKPELEGNHYLGLRVPMGTQDGNQTMRPLFGAANLKSRESLPRAAGTHGYPGWQPNDATPIWSRKPEIKGNYY